MIRHFSHPSRSLFLITKNNLFYSWTVVSVSKGAAISSTLSMGLTYCFCNVAGSLCNACFGNTSATTTGRKRSVLLLTMAIAIALWFQYSVGPAIVQQSETSWIWKSYRLIPGLGKRVYHAWYDSCSIYVDEDTVAMDDASKVHLLNQCAGIAGVFRPTAVATLFFAIFAAATKVAPQLNREAWPAKFGMYLFLVAFTVLMYSNPLFTGLYLWLARLGATIFVLLQQVILIDVAYNWNEDWVNRADIADRYDYGSGSVWLRAIVASCAIFYILSITGIALLYSFFSGCAENTWIITLTLLGILALTGIQLSGTEGSLLTSSVLSLYVTYLAYGMVSKNPNGSCNPYLGNNDVWGITIGLTLTAVSLAWTGWSWTAEERLNVDGVQSARPVTSGGGVSSDQVNLDVPFLDPDDQPTAGLVMDTADRRSSGGGMAGSEVWKLNVVMALISCWVAMTLTGWGAIVIEDSSDGSTGANAANPTIGRVNMAMIGISQWSVILLYVWTLLAPRLFPDRDFS